MPQESKNKGEGLKLDQSKLMGFRNVAAVTKAGDDLTISADATFNKRGTPDSENPGQR